jgi:SAM-dependent methyltransferase
MVAEYNSSALNQGIPPSEMYAVTGNLIAEQEDKALERKEYFDFDIAAVGLGFHHFAVPALAARRLSERLKKGGVLFIVDFLPHEHWDGSAHGHGHGGHGHGHGHGNHEGEGKGKGHDKVKDLKEEMEKRGVTHMGFSEDDVRTLFEKAGVGEDFEYVVIGKGVVFTKENGDAMKREVFMARGRKS